MNIDKLTEVTNSYTNNQMFCLSGGHCTALHYWTGPCREVAGTLSADELTAL